MAHTEKLNAEKVQGCEEAHECSLATIASEQNPGGNFQLDLP